MTSPTEVGRVADLLALAERCEAASGPNIALEQAIALAVYGATATDVDGITVIDGSVFRVPAYTASLDAAVTLVPDRCLWTMDSWSASGWSAGVWSPAARRWIINSDKGRQQPSPALALVAAALRSRAAVLNQEKGQ